MFSLESNEELNCVRTNFHWVGSLLKADLIMDSQAGEKIYVIEWTVQSESHQKLSFERSHLYPYFHGILSSANKRRRTPYTASKTTKQRGKQSKLGSSGSCTGSRAPKQNYGAIHPHPPVVRTSHTQPGTQRKWILISHSSLVISKTLQHTLEHNTNELR